MKVYLSCDVEGTCGIAAWDEAGKGGPFYTYFAEQMSKEVAAACEGANLAGATEIFVKDAHDTARNMDPHFLPENVKICRGWSGEPYSMMSGIDETYDAVIFTGYHSGSGFNGNPLSHTMSSSLNYIKINGEPISEFVLNSYVAGYFGVPVVCVTGDKALCELAPKYVENIKGVPVNEGFGGAAISIHPDLAIKNIRETVKQALSEDLSCYKIKMPKHFKLEIGFKTHQPAFRGQFYPGAKLEDPYSISYESDNYMDIIKFMSFTM